MRIPKKKWFFAPAAGLAVAIVFGGCPGQPQVCEIPTDWGLPEDTDQRFLPDSRQLFGQDLGGRILVPYRLADGSLQARIWDGTQWLDQPVIGPNSSGGYSVLMGALGERFALVTHRTPSPGASRVTELFTEIPSGAFSSGVRIRETEVEILNPSSLRSTDNSDRLLIGFSGSPGSLAASYVEVLEDGSQLESRVFPTQGQILASGLDRDGAPWVVSHELSTGASSPARIRIYKRQGSEWSLVRTIAESNRITKVWAFVSPLGVADEHRLAILMVEAGATAGNGTLSARMYDTLTDTLHPTNTLTTGLDTSFGAFVEAWVEFDPNSEGNGVYSYVLTDSDRAFLGSFSGTVFARAEPFAARLAVQTSVQLGYDSCGVPFAAHRSTEAGEDVRLKSVRFQSLSESEYDGDPLTRP